MKKLFVLLIALMFNISTSFASIYYYTSLEGIVNGADSGLFCDVEDGNCSYDSDLDVSLSFDEESTYLEFGVEKILSYTISGADADIVTLSISSDNEELMDSSTLIIDTENKIITVPAENINQPGEVRIVLQAKDTDGEVVAQAYNYLNIETISSKNMLTLWTVSAGETVQFPIDSSHFTNTYDGHVDWGDDSEIETFTDIKIQDLAHTYTEAGTYEIRIDGGFYDEDHFFAMFYGQTIPTGMDISNWDTSSVNNMASLFYSANISGYLDLSNWDVSSVTNMLSMLRETTLSSINLSSWDVSNVSTTNSLFNSTTISGDIIYNQKVSSYIYSEFMQFLADFSNVLPSSSTSQKIVAGDNYCAEDDTDCFLARKAIQNKGWVIEDATDDIELTIDKDTAFETRWTVSSGETVTFPVYPAYVGYSGIIDWGDGSAVEEFSDLSETTHTYEATGTYTIWMNGSWGDNMVYMFHLVNIPTGFDISSWNISNINGFFGTFWGTTIPTGLDINNWDTSNISSMYYTFRETSIPSGFDINGWDVSSVTDMGGMFYTASLPYDFSFNGWDMSNVKNSASMFSLSTIAGDLIYDETVSSTIYSAFMKILADDAVAFPESTTSQKIYVGDNTCGSDIECISAETTLTNKGWVITRTTAN